MSRSMPTIPLRSRNGGPRFSGVRSARAVMTTPSWRYRKGERLCSSSRYPTTRRPRTDCTSISWSMMCRLLRRGHSSLELDRPLVSWPARLRGTCFTIRRATSSVCARRPEPGELIGLCRASNDRASESPRGCCSRPCDERRGVRLWVEPTSGRRNDVLTRRNDVGSRRSEVSTSSRRARPNRCDGRRPGGGRVRT